MVRISSTLNFSFLFRAFAIACVILLLSACTKKESSSKVTFKIPNFNSSASSKVLSSKISAMETGDSEWGLPDPTALSDFDCFGVMVGASEAPLSQNFCNDANDAQMFRFGPFKGLVEPGATVSIDIPSGPSRSIYLIGFAKAEGVSCETVAADGELTNDLYSAPFLLGSVTKSLAPGPDSVNITASFNANNKIGECTFAKPGGSNGGPPGVFIGSGADGDVSTTGTIIANTVTIPSTSRKITTTSKISNLSIDSADIYNVTLANGALASNNYTVGDEVMMYIAAEGNTGCGGNLVPGFKIPGTVTTAASAGVLKARFADPRVASIVAVASNLNVTATTAGTFCRAVLTRVPNLHNLTLGTSSELQSDAFATLGGTDHDGGNLVIRANGILTLSGTSAKITANESGYVGGNSSYQGDSYTGMGTTTAAINGSGGAPHATAPSGGGHGYSGQDGSGGPVGGGAIGDQYGCGLSSPDSLMQCLLGKMFFGGGGGGSSSQTGGAGGGSISLILNSLVVPSGKTLTIEANGQSAYGGGGAGGSILIRALNLDVQGTLIIKAKGGDSGTTTIAGGAGSGGRVHIDVIGNCQVGGTVQVYVNGGLAGPSNGTPISASAGTKLKTGNAISQSTCNLGF